jgi:drug/metabolite transporter (DMT)-like permease
MEGRMAGSEGGGGPLATGRIRPSYLAWAGLVLVALIHGYNWVVMKSALDYAHPAVFAAMRISLAGLLLLVLMVVLRKPLKPPNWRSTILVGLFGTTGFMGLTFWALESGAAGKTSVLVYTMPIWLLILSRVFLNERMRGYQWLYVGLVVAGLVVVISPWSVGGTVVGNLLALGSGFSSAIGSVLAKTLLKDKKIDLLSLNAWQMLFGCVPLILIAVFTADSGPEWTGWFVVMLLYNAVLASALAMLLWFYSLRQLPAGTAGLGRLMAPVIGVLASALQLGERPNDYEIAGMVLILVGLSLLATHQFLTERRMAPPTGEGRMTRAAAKPDSEKAV